MKRMQIIAFLIAVVFLQVLIPLPFVVDKLGGQYEVVGWLMGSSSLFYAAGSLALHAVVVRFGQRRVLWMVFPTLAACSALFAVAPNIPSLFVIIAILSVALAMFWISMERVFSFQEGGLLRVLARYCVSWSSGDVAGAWLGTKLKDIDLRLPFLVAAGLVLVCWALVIWLERGGRLAQAYSPNALKQETLHGGERFLPATRTMFFFVTAVVGIMFSFVPLIVAKEYSQWGNLSSRVIAIMPLLEACVFFLLGRWDGWVHKTWPLWACPALCVGSTGMLALAGVEGLSASLGAWCFKIGLSLVGASLSFSFIMNLLYSFERPDTRARNGGIHEAILGMGAFLGPVIAGYGAQAAGKGAGAFWVAGGLALVGLALTQVVWLTICRRVRS